MLETESIFPELRLHRLFAELNAWVSVADVARAARILEGRIEPHEPEPQPFIVVYYPDVEAFEKFMSLCIRYLISSFRCPGAKILLAMYNDPRISPETRSLLRDCVATPEISLDRPGVIVGPGAPDMSNYRTMLIRDQPHIIELIYRPVLVLREIAMVSIDTAWKLLELKRESLRNTAGAPTFVHKPSTDSALAAVIDALAFYLCGHEVGYHEKPGHQLDLGYRHIAVVGHPPFPDLFVEAAREMQGVQFGELRRA